MKLIFWRILFLQVLILHFQISTEALAENLKIGALLPLTGIYAMEGNAFKEGITLASEEINQNNPTLEIIFEDSNFHPKTTINAAKKLIEIDQVEALIVGTINEIKVIAQLVENKKIPSIVLWDSAPAIDNLGENIFSIGPWLPSTAEKSAEFILTTLKAQKVALIKTNSDWSLAVGEQFKNKITNLGGKIIQEVELNPEETDYKSILQRILSNNPDAIYAPVNSDLLTFFKQCKNIAQNTPIITSDNLNRHLIQQHPSVFSGVYQTQIMDPANPQLEIAKQKYQKRFNKNLDLPLYVAWGIDATNMIHLASKNQAGITSGLYQIQNYPGASAEISISKGGSSPMYVQVFQVQNGKFQLISK